MKSAVFQFDNRIAIRRKLKTQTRRLGHNPWKANVGDRRALAEPTQIREVDPTNNLVWVKYLDDGNEWPAILQRVSDQTMQKIKNSNLTFKTFKNDI